MGEVFGFFPSYWPSQVLVMWGKYGCRWIVGEDFDLSWALKKVIVDKGVRGEGTGGIRVTFGSNMSKLLALHYEVDVSALTFIAGDFYCWAHVNDSV